jgi:hypothetical protein
VDYSSIYLKEVITKGFQVKRMDILPEDIANLGHRIAVEIGIPVKIELAGIEFALQSTIVGLENNKYIIIKAPEPFQRVEHKLFKGNDLIVRYLSDGTVYAFQTKVMETIVKPLPLLFLEYPSIIQHHELRVQKRLNCHIPVRAILGEQENIGCILDLAVSGCRCLLRATKNKSLLVCDLDNRLELKCIIPGSKEIITLTGTVKNLKRTRKEIDLGINFDSNLTDENRKLLAWFLSTIDGLSFRQ